ncbi:Synembryn-A [Nymphon striatum]|nr:Synembryn-A [Nymphon striatum]
MNDSSLLFLEKGNDDDILRFFSGFNVKNAKTSSFPEISKNIKYKLANRCSSILSSKSVSCQKSCLEFIRILSRDKNNVNELASNSLLSNIIQIAGVKKCDIQDFLKQNKDMSVIVEAQKCLCNLIFNSSEAQTLCCHNGCIDGVITRLKINPNFSLEMKLYDMRILFLLTALCTDTRPKLRNEYHGLEYLTEIMNMIVNKTVSEELNTAEKLNNDEVNLVCEILKVLFNLTTTSNDTDLDEEEESHYLRLVSILHDLILTDSTEQQRKHEILGHIINLLTNMPSSSYEQLLSPQSLNTSKIQISKDNVYDGMNVEAVASILHFLKKQLDDSMNAPSQKESLAPVLACLCESCRSNRVIRKYVRMKILPPLKDVTHRPEEGNTIRNKLCKMMTSPNIDLKSLSAELLFILCKHNVKRFVKYTGYGNAAGLLASRGLMLLYKGKSNSFSSESDDSDTEEYLSQREKINPMTGCSEEPHINPMAEMSEEQKEYEALKLVNLMDKLAREKIIQPTKIGPDGKPHPIEHILELQESPTNDKANHREDED